MSTNLCNARWCEFHEGHMEFNISSTVLLPFPTRKDFSVITLLDSGAGWRVDTFPSLPVLRTQCELKRLGE